MAPHKPSDKEDEFFMKLETEKVAKFRVDLDKKREEEAKKQRREAHWMKCPKCGADLEEINYQNVMGSWNSSRKVKRSSPKDF